MANKGFTLIEMMITVAIAALLLTMAIPSFEGFITRNKLTTQANAFVTALRLARAEAIKRNLAVTVCKSSDGISCTDSETDERGFAQGWIIFTDENNPCAVDADETIIRIGQSMPSGVSLKSINADGETPIRYRADGTIVLNDANTLQLCQQGNINGLRIIIDRPGRAKVEHVSTCPTS